MDALATEVGNLLQVRGLMLATAESCTGGGIAQAITEIAGSSAWFERGFVTYSNLSKQQMLGVTEATLLQHGAVSEATVREMAEGALRHSVAGVSLAVSGIAGPGGGTPEKPVGTVWFAWALRDGAVVAQRYQLCGERAEVRAAAVRLALQGLAELLRRHTMTA